MKTLGGLMSILLRTVWLAVFLAVSFPAGLTSAWAEDDGDQQEDNDNDSDNENENENESEDAGDDDNGGAGGSSGGGSSGAGSGNQNQGEDDDHEFALKGVQAGRLFSLQVILKATRARLATGERILEINLKRRRNKPQYEVTILGRTGTLRTMRFKALRPPKAND